MPMEEEDMRDSRYILDRKMVVGFTRKSPLTPLYQRGVTSSLWQREVGRDFTDNIFTLCSDLYVIKGPFVAQLVFQT